MAQRRPLESRSVRLRRRALLQREHVSGKIKRTADQYPFFSGGQACNRLQRLDDARSRDGVKTRAAGDFRQVLF